MCPLRTIWLGEENIKTNFITVNFSEQIITGSVIFDLAEYLLLMR